MIYILQIYLQSVIYKTCNKGYGGDNYDINKTISPSDMITLTPNITAVPSAFDVKLPGVNGPRGTAFYRAYFDSKQGKDIQVYIAGININ